MDSFAFSRSSAVSSILSFVSVNLSDSSLTSSFRFSYALTVSSLMFVASSLILSKQPVISRVERINGRIRYFFILI
jgi:hypothetical protein